MSRITIDIDDEAAQAVMARYGLVNASQAVNLALRALADGRVSVEQARAMRGIGWEGDLDEMRAPGPLTSR